MIMSSALQCAEAGAQECDVLGLDAAFDGDGAGMSGCALTFQYLLRRFSGEDCRTSGRFFTPNGDGINDCWKNEGPHVQITVIYDRSGREITSLSPGDCWDGTLSGRSCPADDYWYSQIFNDGRQEHGHFALVR